MDNYDIMQLGDKIAKELLADLKAGKIDKIDIDVITDACRKGGSASKTGWTAVQFEQLLDRVTRKVVAGA